MDEEDQSGAVRGVPREEPGDYARAKRLAAGHDADKQGRELDGDRVAEMRSRMADGTFDQKFGEQARGSAEAQKAQRQRSAVAARARRVAHEQHDSSRPASAESTPRTEGAKRLEEGRRKLVQAGKDRAAAQERDRGQEQAAGR